MSLRLSKDAPVGCQRMLTDIRAVARKHGIKLRFTTKKLVKTNPKDSASTGYFDENRKVLAVSNFNDLYTFISVLAHESCHMDQYINDRYFWDKCSVGYTLFFQWLEDGVDVKQSQLEECVQDIIRLELDCEIRSIKKLKKYKIPVDFNDYIKKTNCYLYGYLFFLEKRQWIPAIYQDEEVWKKASSRLSKSYKKIPSRLRKAFEKKLRDMNKTI